MKPTEDTPITESQHSDTQNTNVYQNKQDDKRLDEAIWKFIHAIKNRPYFAEHDYAIEEFKAFFNKAQIQLVSELEGELLKHSHRMRMSGATVNAVTIGVVNAVLEHKKQELERLK